jgi:hypothetical protein
MLKKAIKLLAGTVRRILIKVLSELHQPLMGQIITHKKEDAIKKVAMNRLTMIENSIVLDRETATELVINSSANVDKLDNFIITALLISRKNGRPVRVRVFDDLGVETLVVRKNNNKRSVSQVVGDNSVFHIVYPSLFLILRQLFFEVFPQILI